MSGSDGATVDKRFHEFAGLAAGFSKQIVGVDLLGLNKSSLAEANLEIARTIFGKWSIEIFMMLHNLGPVGFEGLRRSLGTISSRVLSQKLNKTESKELVKRTVINSKPPRVLYSLTEKGLTVARLVEPVFLYLAFKELPIQQRGATTRWHGSPKDALHNRRLEGDIVPSGERT